MEYNYQRKTKLIFFSFKFTNERMNEEIKKIKYILSNKINLLKKILN